MSDKRASHPIGAVICSQSSSDPSYCVWKLGICSVYQDQRVAQIDGPNVAEWSTLNYKATFHWFYLISGSYSVDDFCAKCGKNGLVSLYVGSSIFDMLRAVVFMCSVIRPLVQGPAGKRWICVYILPYVCTQIYIFNKFTPNQQNKSLPEKKI